MVQQDSNGVDIEDRVLLALNKINDIVRQHYEVDNVNNDDVSNSAQSILG